MTSEDLTFLHGKYYFKLSTQLIKNIKLREEVDKAILAQFNTFLRKESSELAIKFYFIDDIEQVFDSKKYQNIGGYCYSSSQIKIENSEVSFVLCVEKEVPIIYFEINSNQKLISGIRALNKGYINAVEKQVSIFYYRVFLILTQYINLQYNSTYIHGATISDSKNNATLFPADSGVGKSSLLFRLSQEKDRYYVADDLSIIDNSKSFYSGRAISTKPYHLNNFTFLDDLVKATMPFAQRLQWQVSKDNRLVFGLCPKKLFSNRIKETANINRVIHLVNTNSSNFRLRNADAHELALASTNILMNEMFLGLFNIYKALSIPSNTMLKSPIDMGEIVKKQYVELFQSAECFILEVPYMSHPELMYSYLKKHDLI